VPIRDICLPGRCLAVELELSRVTSPFGTVLRTFLSALIRSLLLGLPLRVPLTRDLPKPSPRLCVRQSPICYGWLNLLLRSDLALSFDESLVFRVVSNPEPNHGVSVRDAKRSIVVRDTG